MRIGNFLSYTWGFLFTPLNFLCMERLLSSYSLPTSVGLLGVTVGIYGVISYTFSRLQSITGRGSRILFFFEFYLGEAGVLLVHSLLLFALVFSILVITNHFNYWFHILFSLAPVMAYLLLHRRVSLNYIVTISNTLLLGYFLYMSFHRGIPVAKGLEEPSGVGTLGTIFFLFGGFEALFGMSNYLPKRELLAACFYQLTLLFFVNTGILCMFSKWGFPEDVVFTSWVFQLSSFLYGTNCCQEVFKKWLELTSELNLLQPKRRRMFLWPFVLIYGVYYVGIFVDIRYSFLAAEITVIYIYQYAIISFPLLSILFSRRVSRAMKGVSLALESLLVILGAHAQEELHWLGNLFIFVTWAILGVTNMHLPRGIRSAFLPFMLTPLWIIVVSVLTPENFVRVAVIGILGLVQSLYLMDLFQRTRHIILEQID